MEGPASPGKTTKKKKRNPSLRRMLRNEGVDVPPAVQVVRNPALPPKRTAAAAATNEANGLHASAGSSAPGAGSSGAGSPVAAPSPSPSPSPSPGVSLAVSPSPVAVFAPAAVPAPASAPAESPQLAAETDADNVVWDPVDPLGLFDELEGPLDWSSEGLFD